MKSFAILCFTILMISCASRKTSVSPESGIGQLKLLGNYNVEYNKSFRGTTIGGLSGIDYDAKNDLYYLICDDRSAINPARFYTVKLVLGKKGIDSAEWLSVNFLQQPSGKTYPGAKENQALSPDPEGIRYNAAKDLLVWTNEGERIVEKKDTIISNPSIICISKEGKYIDSFPLPENLYMRSIEKGPRRNGVLEGLAFTRDFKTLYVNVEEPLYEDGPRAELEPNAAWIRIYQFNSESKKNTAQYAYHLEPVAYPAIPENAFKINGVPDIYAVGEKQLLVMERSYSTGRIPCTIKIFQADLTEAEDIRNNTSLIKSPPKKPAVKKLLLNMDDLGIYVDNVEGMSFGPTLPNGHKTLVLVADNNFLQLEQTQFFLFEIIPN